MSGRDRNVNEVTVSSDYTVPIDMDYVFVDGLAADATITLKRTKDRLVRWHKVKKIDGSAFVVTVTDETLSYVLSAQGQAATFEIDVNGNFHVFADSSGAAAGSVNGSGTPGIVPMFTAPTTIGDSELNQSSGVVSVGANFGVVAATGVINNYGGSAPTDGQLLIGDTGVGFVPGSLASADNSVTITPSAGGIDLSVGSIALETATPSTGDGVETEFVFVGIPVMPMRNGVAYSPSAFTVLGTTVTITVPPPDGEITALTR